MHDFYFFFDLAIDVVFLRYAGGRSYFTRIFRFLHEKKATDTCCKCRFKVHQAARSCSRTGVATYYDFSKHREHQIVSYLYGRRRCDEGWTIKRAVMCKWTLFCHKCIGHLLSTYTSAHDASGLSDIAHFTCPICRVISYVPTGGLCTMINEMARSM